MGNPLAVKGLTTPKTVPIEHCRVLGELALFSQRSVMDTSPCREDEVVELETGFLDFFESPLFKLEQLILIRHVHSLANDETQIL